jgi:hypothetical protein
MNDRRARLRISLPSAPSAIDEFHLRGSRSEVNELVEDIRRHGYEAELVVPDTSGEAAHPVLDIRQQLFWLFED